MMEQCATFGQGIYLMVITTVGLSGLAILAAEIFWEVRDRLPARRDAPDPDVTGEGLCAAMVGLCDAMECPTGTSFEITAALAKARVALEQWRQSRARSEGS